MAHSLQEKSEGRQMLLQRSKHRALSCLYEHEYSRSFAHFLVALTVEPTIKGELMHAFLFTLDKLSEELEKEGKLNDVLMCYDQALELLPKDSYILHGLATMLYRFGFFESAASYYLKSYQECPYFIPSLYCMENLKNALVERWHFIMLNDKKRNSAYLESIKSAISSGCETVLDIGAGTGILSMMAFDAGAEKVYACESSEMMFTVLQNVLKANEKDIKVFQKFSYDLSVPTDIPEKVSLVVTEIFDVGLFGEHCLTTLDHAWEHLLLNSETFKGPKVTLFTDGLKCASDIQSSTDDANNDAITQNKNVGKVIPHAATVFAVPLECERVRAFLRLDDSILEALGLQDLTVVPVALKDEPYASERLANIVGGFKALGEACQILDVNFNSIENIQHLIDGETLSTTFKCHTRGNLDAIAVWFHLHLDEHTTISTAPEDNGCWEQAIFYVIPQYVSDCSTSVEVEDTIEVTFLCKGHLTLQNIKTSAISENVDRHKYLSVDPLLINLLNTFSRGNSILQDVGNIFEVKNSSVIDISTFPLLGLKLLNEGSNSVTVLKTECHREIMEIQDHCKLPNKKLQYKSYEELYSSRLHCDYIIVDPVDTCGLLKKNILEDAAMLRKQCSTNAVVVPGDIEIHVILIQSDTLYEQSKVVSNERTAGYNISQVMNAYQCRIHQDIEFSTLLSKRLSKPTKLCNITLNEKTEKRNLPTNSGLLGTTEVELICEGKISAILFWFMLKYGPDTVVDTADPKTLWKQAACIMAQEIPVAKSEKVCLQWTCRNSCLDIHVQDKVFSKH